MEVLDGMYAGQSQIGCSHVGRFRSTFFVRFDTVMSFDLTAVQVRISG